VRHGLLLEQAQRLEAQLEHPFGLVLERRDVADHVLAETTGSVRSRKVSVVPTVFVVADRSDRLVLRHGDALGGSAHARPSFRVAVATGMVVVQTWAPLARVDRRCTWTSR